MSIKQEIDLIPYHTSELPNAPYLIFAPHPDDETLGMGGTIILAKKQNLPITVVFMTMGEQGGDPKIRQKEALDAAKILGIDEVEFFRIPDRKIATNPPSTKKLDQLLSKVTPKTIFLPSFLEFHPDHRATTFSILNYLKDISYEGEIWLYEISRQAEVNKLIDITSVVDIKRNAIKAYKTQIQQKAYDLVTIAINQARSFTLDKSVKFAEGFYAFTLESGIFSQIKYQKYILDLPEAKKLPLVTVIIRTKDRLQLLKEALESVAEQTYPFIEALIINDGGNSPAEVVELFKDRIYKVRLINFSQNIGRSRSGNKGIKEAQGDFIIFLDDDDVFYSHHIETLVDCARKNKFKVVYSDSYIAEYKVDSFQNKQLIKKYVYYSYDFSFEHLLLENYIPLLCLLFDAKLLKQTGGFDSAFDLYEDWDLLIRVASIVPFYHIRLATCEYRQWSTGQITHSSKEKRIEEVAFERLIKKHGQYIGVNALYEAFVRSGQRKGEIFQLQERLSKLEKNYSKRLHKITYRFEKALELLFRQKEKHFIEKRKLEAIIHEQKQNIHLLEKKIDELAKELDHYIRDNKLLSEQNQNIYLLEKKIDELAKELDHYIRDNKLLNAILTEITSSTGWRILLTYRKMVEKIAPPNSRLGHYYFLSKRTLSVLKQEGVKGLTDKIRYRLRNKRALAIEEPAQNSSRLLTTSFPKKPVSIIIPVYNALEDLTVCLKSIERSTDLSFHTLYIIDDNSPEKKVKKFLKEYTAQQNDKKIHIIFNQKNLGFSGTVNKGIELAGNNDVLVLNSDTIVSPGWLERLQRAAYSVPLVATVTPWSNHAFICSIPNALEYNFLPNNFTVQGFAEFIYQNSLFYYPQIPFGSGFCMYIRRKAIRVVGLFDKNLFGKGYGEDTDFCFRANNAGFKNLLDDTTFVYHRGGASFESDKDPIKLKEKNKMISQNLNKLQKKYPNYYELVEESVSQLSFIRNHIKYCLKNAAGL